MALADHADPGAVTIPLVAEMYETVADSITPMQCSIRC